MNLSWDVQGPDESEDVFRARINGLVRDKEGYNKDDSAQYNWKIGKERRKRGTVQSDEFLKYETVAAFTNNRLIAVMPILGWWDNVKKNGYKNKKLNFSLVITTEVFSKKNIDIYNYIEQRINVPVPIQQSIKIS